MAQNRRNSQPTNWVDDYGTGAGGKSLLACSACRRKKNRCDRTLPSCLPCARLQQTCVYPTRRLKPGPKSRTSPQRWKRPSVDEARGKEHWQGAPDVGVQSDDNDAAVSAYSDDDGSGSFEEGDDSASTSASPEVEINFVKALSLSSLIHPTHEPCSPPMPLQEEATSSDSLLNLIEAQSLLMEACTVLGLSIQEFQHLTDSYFDNMTAFSLFHRPSFVQKIQNIKDPVHLQALFAAMFSYSAKFEPANSSPDDVQPATSRFHQLALDLIEQALKEIPDQPPTFCLLQALTVITFCEMTTGVRTRAWRLLGSCVRLAYELHMHLIDYEARKEDVKIGRDLARWTTDEERRRCWWAIWEMDTFASTIRRCPTAIDWNMIDTYLPVPDELWFNNQYHPGCFLEIEPVNRWKMLAKHRNENPSAWLIVISSIMRNAQVLLRGNLQGVLLNLDPHDNSEQLLHYFRNSFRRKTTQEDSTKLTTLVHALQNVMIKIPDSLVYRGEYLDFGSDSAGVVVDVERKRLHAAKYNIYLTIQLARFMIYHHYAFGEIISGTIFSDKHKHNPKPGEPNSSPADREPLDNAQGLRNCLQAADDICALTERCSKDHVKHVSPFLASTVWLAASLQVLRKIFAHNNQEVHESTARCETLRTTCGRFSAFWNTPLALLDNLDSLEARLCHYRDLFLATAAPTNKPRPGHPVATTSTSQSRRPIRRQSAHSTLERVKPQHNLSVDDRLSSSVDIDLAGSAMASNDPRYQHQQPWDLKSNSVSISDSTERMSSTSIEQLSTFNPHLPPSSPVHHLPMRDGNIGVQPNTQNTSLVNLDYYQPQDAYRGGQLSGQGIRMGNEPELDSVFSQYLLEVFSEPF